MARDLNCAEYRSTDKPCCSSPCFQECFSSLRNTKHLLRLLRRKIVSDVLHPVDKLHLCASKKDRASILSAWSTAQSLLRPLLQCIRNGFKGNRPETFVVIRSVTFLPALGPRATARSEAELSVESHAWVRVCWVRDLIASAIMGYQSVLATADEY